ncbi:MAG: UDP-glucose/GDP-mannose dehydrogenase family protein, partial [Candidatus Omnitrophica bacterium]|nr:UDP-glucose/GDP-mannose dehydrogenase family protein [Candidatus Omnitrophota bacterium]
LEISQMLAEEGYKVGVFDPQAMENAKGVLGDRVRYASSVKDCVTGADAVVIAVPWQDFKNLDCKKLKKGAVVLDCWRLLEGKGKGMVRNLGVGI